MDLSGIDCAVWFPTLGLFTSDIQNWDFQYAVMRALNDWTAKDFATGKRHLWCASIPLKPEWAVEEIKRCRKMGATAVWMRPNVMQEVRWWGEDWDPVWKTMADLGMALVFHEATGTYNATYSTDYKFDRYWIAHAVSHPLEMAASVAAIIGYGVLERHPGLRVAILECGGGWIAHWMDRLDEFLRVIPDFLANAGADTIRAGRHVTATPADRRSRMRRMRQHDGVVFEVVADLEHGRVFEERLQDSERPVERRGIEDRTLHHLHRGRQALGAGDVENAHRLAALDQQPDEVPTDETAAAGNEVEPCHFAMRAKSYQSGTFRDVPVPVDIT